MLMLCIQEFLNDYGMVWVGKEEDVDGREAGGSVERSPGQVTGAMWNPAASVTGDPTASSTVKFDTIVKNIKVHTYIHAYYCVIVMSLLCHCHVIPMHWHTHGGGVNRLDVDDICCIIAV